MTGDIETLRRMTAIHQILADAPDDALLTSAQAADYLGLRRSSMAPIRSRGQDHPVYVKIGSAAVRYRLGDLRRWVRDRTYRHTTEASAAASGR